MNISEELKTYQKEVLDYINSLGDFPYKTDIIETINNSFSDLANGIINHAVINMLGHSADIYFSADDIIEANDNHDFSVLVVRAKAAKKAAELAEKGRMIINKMYPVSLKAFVEFTSEPLKRELTRNQGEQNSQN